MTDGQNNQQSTETVNPQVLDMSQEQGLIVDPPISLDPKVAAEPSIENVTFNLEKEQPVSAESSALVDTIVHQATAGQPEQQLAILPELGTDQLSRAELTSLQLELQNNSKLADLSRTLVLGVLIVGLIMTGYFFYRYQATERLALKANLSLSQAVTDRANLEADYNYKVYQIIVLETENLFWDGLELIQNEQSQTGRQENLRKIVESRLSNIENLVGALTVFEAPDPKVYRADLVRELPKELKTTNVASVIRSKQIHEDLGNEKRLAKVKALDSPEFIDWLEMFLDDLNLPETALVKINHDRLQWSKIIQEIENTTRQIDPLFGQPNSQFVVYTNYNFNARTNQITLTGQIRTDNEKTFTQIANLIDAIEANPNFQNVKTRSFTKNIVDTTDDNTGITTEEYQATLKLDFEFVRANGSNSNKK